MHELEWAFAALSLLSAYAGCFVGDYLLDRFGAD
jgi:hypothetical protein